MCCEKVFGSLDANRNLHICFTADELWDRFQPVRDGIFQNCRATLGNIFNNRVGDCCPENWIQMAHHGRLLAKCPQTPKLQEAFPVKLRTLPSGSHLGSEAPAPSPQSSPIGLSGDAHNLTSLLCSWHWSPVTTRTSGNSPYPQVARVNFGSSVY